MTAAWVGVDPGSRGTGIVVRCDNQLLGWAVITRDHDETPVGPGPDYIAAVVAAINTIRARHGHPAPLAVELLNPPTGFRDGKPAPLRPADVAATGIVLGGILAHHPDAVLVPPNHHGEGLLAAYPADLVTAKERAAGLNRQAGRKALIRHARASWDLIPTARALRRQQLITAGRTR